MNVFVMENSWYNDPITCQVIDLETLVSVMCYHVAHPDSDNWTDAQLNEYTKLTDKMEIGTEAVEAETSIQQANWMFRLGTGTVSGNDEWTVWSVGLTKELAHAAILEENSRRSHTFKLDGFEHFDIEMA